jgi:hypothetical protein
LFTSTFGWASRPNEYDGRTAFDVHSKTHYLLHLLGGEKLMELWREHKICETETDVHVKKMSADRRDSMLALDSPTQLSDDGKFEWCLVKAVE